jgi:hypothetical protein
VVSVPTRPIWLVARASADSSVSGSSRLRKCGAVSGVMNGLSTMNTRSNFAASARRACSTYQSMLMLALLGSAGSRQACWIGADALQDGAEMQLAGLGHRFLLFARRLRPIAATTDNEHC